MFLFFLLAEGAFFYNVIDINTLIGEAGDGRVTNFITEHWFDYFCGKVSFGDLRTMYPVKGTIAYSDMLLGYGLIHSIFRILGFNVLLSYKFTLITIHFIGTFSMMILLHKVMKK